METKDRVVAAATRLLAAEARDRITLASVAAESGLSVQTIRRQLGGKVGLKRLIEGLAGPADSDNPDTRQRVLAAAKQVFARRGYTGATLEQVARAAALTKGAVYWHFESKADLFIAMLREGHRQQARSMEAILAEIDGGREPREVLEVWLTGQLRSYRTDREQAALFWEFFAQRRDPAVGARLRTVWRSFLGDVTELIAQLQERGLVSPEVSPDTVSLVVDALLNGLVVAWLVDPERVDFEGLGREIASILWRGLTPRGQ